jgi:hypothetical protein
MVKQRAIPIIEYQGCKVISDLPKLVFFLYENFKGEFLLHGYWPKKNLEEVMHHLEWYAYKFRPFMQEFYQMVSSLGSSGTLNLNFHHEGS